MAANRVQVSIFFFPICPRWDGALHGVEKHLRRGNIGKCFLITPEVPHENVLNYAQKIEPLDIIISSDFREERKRIEGENPDKKILFIDPYHLAERDSMLDA